MKDQYDEELKKLIKKESSSVAQRISDIYNQSVDDMILDTYEKKIQELGTPKIFVMYCLEDLDRDVIPKESVKYDFQRELRKLDYQKYLVYAIILLITCILLIQDIMDGMIVTFLFSTYGTGYVEDFSLLDYGLRIFMVVFYALIMWISTTVGGSIIKKKYEHSMNTFLIFVNVIHLSAVIFYLDNASIFNSFYFGGWLIIPIMILNNYFASRNGISLGIKIRGLFRTPQPQPTL
jgi:hypothetical protein